MSEIKTENENKHSLQEDILNEIQQENAQEAEQTHISEIPLLDYQSMSLEALNQEFRKLISNENPLNIKKHIEAIRTEFEQKYETLLDTKKAEYIADGGEEYDFKYESSDYKIFNGLMNEYREKRNDFRKELEKKYDENLKKRKEIIEEIKNLINTEENINTTFKLFNQLQERWRNAGAVSHVHYNDLWSNYHHHVENFYDFIHLSRDMRDADFKRNLEEKLKLIEKAESLANQEVDVMKAIRELNYLHRIWKEDIGPVDREHREEIWQKFSDITKKIHERKQQYFTNLDKILAENADKKRVYIQQIKEITQTEAKSFAERESIHNQVVTLRDAFLKVGRVPSKESESIWRSFKEVFKTYNHSRNEFFKNLKSEQQKNLTKKLALLEIAKANKDSKNWEETTPIMKKIQEEWKEIGAVPKKNVEKITKEFKKACNFYFDEYYKSIKANKSKELEALDKKKAFLDSVKEYKLSENREVEIKKLQDFVNQWEEIGKTSFAKKGIDSKFHKIIDDFYKKLDFEKQEIELIKYNSKLEKLANEDEDAINQEVIFVRKKIEELQLEILQLENNLQFFTNVDENNPLVRSAIKNINVQKENLEVWKGKLRELKNLYTSQSE